MPKYVSLPTSRRDGREAESEKRSTISTSVDFTLGEELRTLNGSAQVLVCVGKVEVQGVHTWKIIEWLHSLGM